MNNLRDLVERPLEDVTGMTSGVNNRRQFLYIQNYHEKRRMMLSRHKIVTLNYKSIYKAAFQSALTMVHSRSGGGDNLTGRHLAIRTNNQLRIILG